MQSYKLLVFALPLGLVCAQTPAPKSQKAPAAQAATPTPGATAAPQAPAVDPNKVVLTIGTEKITAKDFDSLLDSVVPPDRRGQFTSPTQKRDFAEQLIRMKLLAQEAQRRGLDKDPKVKLQYENMLAGAMFKDMQNEAKVTDASLQKSYDEHKSEMEEAQARHILIRFKGSPVPLKTGEKDLTEEEALAKAQTLRKEIAAGKDFATIAKAESDDTGSAQTGGDLGKFRHGQMVPEFDKAAFSLPVGQVSEPIKTQFGYHLIKVESRTTKSFDQAKPELEKTAKPEAAKEALEQLRKTASVSLDDSFFGPAAAAGTPSASAAVK